MCAGMLDDTGRSMGLIGRALDGIDPKLRTVLLPWAMRHPRRLGAYVSLARAMTKAQRTRARELRGGLKVPPFLILSVTSRCNLACRGCYASATGNLERGVEGGEDQLSLDDWRSVVSQARELGVFAFVLAGGEPFLFPNVLDLCEEFDDRLFLAISNGTVTSHGLLRRLGALANAAVLVSIEGDGELTDQRRGAGVHDKAMRTMGELDAAGVPTGVSATITRMNHGYWMEERNVDELIGSGARLVALMEYIPVTAPGECRVPPSTASAPGGMWSALDDRELMLTPRERAAFRQRVLEYRERKPIYIVHSPGDEGYFGGCVSAGRGFAHVTPAGDLTPCPVSNIATHNLTDASLREALASPLFREIRENDGLLETGGMPCALFAHPREVDELARSVGAYRTGRERNGVD